MSVIIHDNSFCKKYFFVHEISVYPNVWIFYDIYFEE